jgi:hypothetical protein
MQENGYIICNSASCPSGNILHAIFKLNASLSAFLPQKKLLSGIGLLAELLNLACVCFSLSHQWYC